MKKVSLSKKDAYELWIVLSGIINQNSKDIDFKDIINLQKAATAVKQSVMDYSEKIDAIEKQKEEIASVANKIRRHAASLANFKYDPS